MNPDFHHVPGRLRVRVSGLRRNETAARQAERSLAVMAGVTTARVNPVTGSITITYDPGVLGVEQLLDRLVARGYGSRELFGAGVQGLGSVASRATNVGASQTGEALARATLGLVVEMALERSARALIAAIA